MHGLRHKEIVICSIFSKAPYRWLNAATCMIHEIIHTRKDLESIYTTPDIISQEPSLDLDM